MTIQTVLTERLGISFPIIQAPMGGGASTVELTTAVCEAGGLGFMAAAYLTPAQIAAQSRQVREWTARPFGINLFAPTPPPPNPERPELALERLAPIHK